MNKTVVLFWPTKGSVEHVATKVFNKLENAEIHNLGEFDHKQIADFQNVVLCGSTVGYEMWDKAESNDKWGPLFYNLEKDGINLKSKNIALVGLGNQIMYPDHFADGMGNLRDDVLDLGGTLVGKWPSEGYDFMDSNSLDSEGYFCGLVIDEDNEFDLTDERISDWVDMIRPVF